MVETSQPNTHSKHTLTDTTENIIYPQMWMPFGCEHSEHHSGGSYKGLYEHNPIDNLGCN